MNFSKKLTKALNKFALQKHIAFVQDFLNCLVKNKENFVQKFTGAEPHFLKWLKLVSLLDYGSKGITYDFLNMVFIKFGIPSKIFIDHMKFHGEFQKH